MQPSQSTSRQPLFQRLAIGLGPILSGVLLCCAHPPLDFSLLSWIALVPLAWSMANASKRIHFLPATIGGLVYGFGGITFAMLFAGQYEVRSGYLLGWFVACSVAVLMYVGVYACGCVLVKRTRWPMVLILPIVWTAHEFVRQHGIALIDEAGFPFGKLSTTQADWNVLAQIADLGGAYALSFIVAMVNGMWCDVITLAVNTHGDSRNKKLLWSPALAATIVAATACYGMLRIAETSETTHGPTVALMGEKDVPPLLERSRIATESENAPDLLVWSEHVYHHVPLELSSPANEIAADCLPDTMVRLAQNDPAGYAQRVDCGLRDSARGVASAYLLGCQRATAGHDEVRSYNSLAFVDCAGNRAFYDKHRLVPWAEYTPHGEWLSGPADCANFTRGASPTVFELNTSNGQNTRFGCGICFDIYFPSHFRGMFADRDNMPEFIVHSAAEGLDPSGATATTSLRMAKLRAIETRRCIVRNVMGGDSGLVDSAGRLVIHTADESIIEPTHLGSVPIDSRMSFYVLAGDWLPMLLCLTIIGVIVLRPRQD